MSIESYDVEPVDISGAAAWVLGITGAVTGVLAVIGWPLPVVSRRFGPLGTWAQTVSLVQDWWQHDGWRTSGDSWLWAGIAIAATTAAVRYRRRGRPVRSRTWLVVLVPGTAVAVLGPIAQVTAGLPWRNYADGHVSPVAVVVFAVVLAGVVGVLALRAGGEQRRQRSDSGR